MKHLGADPQCLEATRVLRTIGSYNSKSGSEVRILEEYDYKYTLEEIQENYIPELTEVVKKPKINKPKKKKRGRPKKIVSIFNLYNLYAKRIQDIETLCELRSYDLKGHRELILFLYRYFSNVFYADSEEGFLNTLELNSRFIEPLDEYELLVDTQSAERYWIENRYKYSNAKLIRLLEITEEEQKALIAENPSYAVVVCRCETVTEGEILDAIRRSLGAKTLDGIKRRTRAGMGLCQAGFCTPKTMELIAKEWNVPVEDIVKSGRGSHVL